VVVRNFNVCWSIQIDYSPALKFVACVKMATADPLVALDWCVRKAKSILCPRYYDYGIGRCD